MDIKAFDSLPNRSHFLDLEAQLRTGQPESKLGTGAQAGEQRVRADQQTTQQGVKDENISPRESTARPTDRGRGRRNAEGGEKLSLREDI